jgi:pimeloyl-ACP methyl ester carboxylesterase
MLNAERRGRGAPILILHGARLDHRHMMDALEPVFDGLPGWLRVYVDLPGCGASTGFGDVSSQADVLRHLARFASGTFGEAPFAIIGESRGSILAQGLAHLMPDRVAGMALIVPGDATPEEKASNAPDPLPVWMADLEPNLRARAARLVVRDRAIVDRIRDTKLPAAALHDAALEARVTEAFDLPFRAEMERTPFAAPCLVISGRQDDIAGHAEAMAMLPRLPRATYALLDRAGHSLSWERPALFAALMRDWLGRMGDDDRAASR